jgi:glycosyltransferase involved in cell wall biosynthesis
MEKTGPLTSAQDQRAGGLPKKRLRIAYLTANDPADRRSWSGTDFSMAQALERHCGEVVSLGPLRPLQARVGKIIKRGFELLGGPTYLYAQTTSVAKKLARMAEQKLADEPCDVIFAPAGSVPLAYLQTKIPIVYLSDITFHLIVDYYHEFSRLFRPHARMADEIERLAIAKADRLIYPSSWAARSAIDDYGANPDIVHVVPFGANFETPPSREDALQIPKKDRCRLLFVGANWERKGGQYAVETLLALEKMGIGATLTIVGCRPPENIIHKDIHVIPFLDKNKTAERERLYRLYCDSHFFILPTRAECYSIALCEANAFGLPVLATQTGGLPELVREGINGFLLPLEAGGDRYAALVRELYADEARYEALRRSSRGEFESRLNWDAWGKKVGAVIRSAALDGAMSLHSQLTT